MLRKAFVMQVNTDCHQEYERRHSPIWPELAETLKAHGAHNYAIWLDVERHLLFASVEIGRALERGGADGSVSALVGVDEGSYAEQSRQQSG